MSALERAARAWGLARVFGRFGATLVLNSVSIAICSALSPEDRVAYVRDLECMR